MAERGAHANDKRASNGEKTEQQQEMNEKMII